MSKNRLFIIVIALVVGFLTFNIKAKALTDAEKKLCENKSAGCFCLKTDSSKCTLQIGAPSGHNYHLVNKDNCGCPSNSPQNYTSVTETSSSSNNDALDLCKNAGVLKAAQIVGYFLYIMKIVVPILLIIMGAVEFGKAVVSSDDKAIKAATSSLIKRAITAVVVFFVPAIIAAVINIVGGMKENYDKFKCLSTCIKTPSSCKIPANKVFS